MSKGNILITGGAGYIGSHINKQLNLNGYNTIVFDNLIYGHKDFLKWGTFCFGDLSNQDHISNCFSKYKIDAVVHLAAYAYVGESVHEPLKYYQNNVANTLNMLKCMKDFNVKNIVFSSSCAVYGVPNELPISEAHSLAPINPYGRSKQMVESILRDFDQAYGLKYISLRFFNAAGADFDGEIGERHIPETHLIPLAIKAALSDTGEFKIYGTNYPTKDGTCIRDYIHVDDLAQAHIKALEYLFKNKKSDIFNLGNGMGISVLELVNCVKEISNMDFKVILSGERQGDPPSLISSYDRARKYLVWEPVCTSIHDIVKSAWKWHVKDSLKGVSLNG